MKRKKKKSLVEKTNSWKPFIEEIQGALQAKDFRKKAICNILQTLDSDVSAWPGSFLRYIGGTIIGSGFPLGRSLLYGDIVKRFLENNLAKFKQSPPLVIKGFNKLMHTLFSERDAKKYLLPETLARRKLTPEEKILKQGEEARKRLRAFVEQAQTEGEAPPPPPPPELEEERPELEFKRKKIEFSSKEALDPRTIEYFEDLADEGIEIKKELIVALEKAAVEFSLFTHTAYNALPVCPLGPLTDLADAMKKLGTILYFDETEVRLLASSEEWEKIIEEKIRSVKKAFEEIVQKGNELKNKIAAIIDDIASSKKLLEPFLRKKDTKGRVQVLLNQLSLLELDPSLVKEKTAVIEHSLKDKKEKIEKVLSIFQKEFFKILFHLQDLEMKADRLKLEIMYARWEIFSRHTPFADLRELVDQVEESILSALSTSDEELVVGEKSFEEICSAMLDSLYTHNVRLVRWELLSRALRLKDIRGRVENELLLFDRYIGLLRLEGKAPEKILEERRWLYSFFLKLLCPYSVFQDTWDPESINVLFRYFWLDLDRFKERKESLKPLLQSAENSPQTIHALNRCAEIMEKMYGARVKVDESSLLEWLGKMDDEFALLPYIAAHSYTEKEAFLLRLKNLSQKKEEIEKLARAVQAVKTFEPERIEALLEAFTLLRFPQEPLDTVEHRLEETEKILDRIEEAVVCELGLLDIKSRMESGYAVDALVEEAKRELPHVTARACKLLDARRGEPNFVGRASSLLETEEKKVSDDIFSAARETALLFFQNKLLCAAAQPDSLARPILVLFLFEKLFSFLSKELPQTKGAKVSELFSFSRKFFYLVFPKPLQKEMVIFLKEFSNRVQALDPTMKIEILSELELIRKDIETTVSWNIPILSFLPGDLSYFLKQ